MTGRPGGNAAKREYLYAHAVYMNGMLQTVFAILAGAKVAPPELLIEAMDSLSFAYQTALANPEVEGRTILQEADALVGQAIERFRARMAQHG